MKEANVKALRNGWTTGTCATAAALAAVHLLVESTALDQVTVILPKGGTANLVIENLIRLTENQVCASVIKDGGDDIDVTHGLEITATVKRTIEKGISIKGGVGIGKVTRAGLSVPVGEWAINPVPREMLISHLTPYLRDEGGFEVVIEAPKGQEAAEKTFNGRLGIMGGISIIGTSGRVEPMSEEAFKASLEVALKQAIVLGERELVFVFGNYGESYAKNNGIPETAILKMSNFVGFMLDKALEYGAQKVVLVGNIGKLVKVASGSFHTHSHISDGKFETLVAHLALMGAPVGLLEQVMGQATTEAVVAVLEANKQLFGDYSGVYQRLAESAKTKCLERVRNGVAIEVVLFSDQKRFLSSTDSKWCPNREDISVQPPRFSFIQPPRFSVVGIGPGDLSLLTLRGQMAIGNAQVVLGAKRQLEAIKVLLKDNVQIFEVNGRIGEMVALIDAAKAKSVVNITVLASGDPLVYGIGQRLRERYPEIEIISGISAIQYLFTKIPVPMQDVYVTSCHGRPLDIDKLLAVPIDKIAMVTDAINHPSIIAKSLLGQRVTLYIGSNLGYPNETILSGGPEDLQHFDGQGLHVLVIKKERYL